MRLLLCLLAVAQMAAAAVPAADRLPADPDPARWVDPLIGTRNMGHVYPGATAPFGAVQLSPDTRRVGMYDDAGKYTGAAYPYCSGYQYEDSVIVGFSHTHFSGTGHSDLGDVSVMPFSGDVDLTDPATWTSRFRHATESASPGAYAVTLDDPQVRAEFTATERVGLHRYDFQGDAGGLVLDLTFNIYDYPGKNLWSTVRVENDTLVTGWRMTSGWAKTRTVYFAMVLSEPIAAYSLQRLDATPYNGFDRRFDKEHDFPECAGRELRARFDLPGDVQVKVGLSAVSTAGALANLRAEAPGWDFDAMRAAARAAWNRELGKLRVRALDDTQRTVLTTALYHTMLAPTVYEDADGRYRGLDGNVRESRGFVNHTVFSLWDTFRAQHPWLLLAQPVRARHMVHSMLAHFDQSVHPMLPVWSHHANENWCMIGYHAVSVLADAAVKGLGGFDAERALRACVATSNVPYFDGVGEMLELGYVPDEAARSAASVTLELAYDDWCIARLAEHLGDTETAAAYDARARNWENLWDAQIGFIRPRGRDGRWREPFDVMATHDQGFIEGNAWTYSLFVPQDPARLVELCGGPAAFGARLDSLFTMTLDDAHIAHTEDITRDGLVGNYVHGNEPGHHVPYLYLWSDRPWQTQSRVRQLLADMYGTGPAGLCGNDDAGQMSAWSLFSALGFYPVAPGSAEYAVGSPAVLAADLELEGGKVLRVRTEGQSAENVYVDAVLWNGVELGRPFLEHAALMQGGELRFRMRGTPKP